MTAPPGTVLVAEELAAVWDGEPDWPGGHATRLLGRSEELPADDRVVALIPLLSRRIGARELDGLPALRIVANYAVGVDNIDLAAAAERGVVVTNTPDVLTEATGDLTWALLLAAARRLREGLDLARSGRWRGWEPGQLLGMGHQGRTLGILGAGRIGSAVISGARERVRVGARGRVRVGRPGWPCTCAEQGRRVAGRRSAPDHIPPFRDVNSYMRSIEVTE